MHAAAMVEILEVVCCGRWGMISLILGGCGGVVVDLPGRRELAEHECPGRGVGKL